MTPERETRGSCLCGAVMFVVRGEFRRANHCHCSRCRKHSGSIGLAQGRVRRSQFELLSGADELVGCAAEGVFCRTRGSSLFGGT